ncbi:MAG: hypothetical protein EZS28_032494, partial [Streblomastix strix]
EKQKRNVEKIDKSGLTTGDPAEKGDIRHIGDEINGIYVAHKLGFKVIKFEALSAPSAQHGVGSCACEYGTEWKKNK